MDNLSVDCSSNDDVDASSISSYGSVKKNIKLGKVTFDERDLAGEYLPEERKKTEMSIVPDEPMFLDVRAPNSRLDAADYT